jgi:hypothetical protein
LQLASTPISAHLLRGKLLHGKIHPVMIRCCIGRSMSNSNPRFTPHALILTERSVPEPMFVAAVIGVGARAAP